MSDKCKICDSEPALETSLYCEDCLFAFDFIAKHLAGAECNEDMAKDGVVEIMRRAGVNIHAVRAFLADRLERDIPLSFAAMVLTMLERPDAVDKMREALHD